MNLYLIENPTLNLNRKKLIIEDILDMDRFPNLKILKDREFDIIRAAKNGYHIISIAFIGLTYFSSVCEFGLNINQSEQEQFVSTICKKKETGTLYPKHNLTILPYRYETNAFTKVDSLDYTDGNGFTLNEVKSHVKDAFKAETDYIKSGKIVFDFRDLDEDIFRYRNVVKDFLSVEYKDYDWEVYIF